jgi:hypothetical protein
MQETAVSINVLSTGRGLQLVLDMQPDLDVLALTAAIAQAKRLRYGKSASIL